MLTRPQTFNKNDLEILAKFVLQVGNDIIHYNANHKSTFVKTFLFSIVRLKLPKHIKQAILESGISASKHKTFDDIKNIKIKITNPYTQKIKEISFQDFFCYHFIIFPDKSEWHKNSIVKTKKERMENYAKNASKVSIGNCNECCATSENIWVECTAEVRKVLGLPNFSENNLPHMEQVFYHPKPDHCYNIINRPLSSKITNVASWVKDGTPVFINDLWKDPKNIICVNDQLKLKPKERHCAFNELLENQAKLKVYSLRTLGEGHSPRWNSKRRDEHFFIKHKYPNLFLFKQKNNIENNNSSNTPEANNRSYSAIRTHENPRSFMPYPYPY